MRKKFCILLCLLLILTMCACRDKDKEIKVPAKYYYINSDISYNAPDGVIRAELRESADFQRNLEMLLSSYLDGPESSTLETYIPSDTTLISCMVTDNSAEIVLSEEFSKLTGVKLSIACSAMLLTVHDYVGADEIVVRSKGSLLDEKYEIKIAMDDVVLMDSVPIEDQ